MLQVDIPSAVRTVFGKGAMRRLRKNNQVPGVCYSGGAQPIPLQFDSVDLHKNLLFIHGRNAVITLDVEGDDKRQHHVLVQEIQQDPVTDRVIHVDLLEIDLDKPLDFEVPLEFTGTAKGVDMGGELQVFKEVVHLRGRALDIPDAITTDITPLERGGAGLTFGDLELPANVEMLDDPGVVCVTVY
ncbi:MAG TPA: 50S ribosomal protein L25 [Desulfobulbus sp.]|nr:50S ribosomal protein L25 [Desulfobulbus sp.]